MTKAKLAKQLRERHRDQSSSAEYGLALKAAGVAFDPALVVMYDDWPDGDVIIAHITCQVCLRFPQDDELDRVVALSRDVDDFLARYMDDCDTCAGCGAEFPTDL